MSDYTSVPYNSHLSRNMETILGGQNVSAATAGILSDRSAEGTAPGYSVGWLAIARPATLELWLESGNGGGSRGLNVANETELDDRVLALAACPRRKSCVERWRHVFFLNDDARQNFYVVFVASPIV